MTVVPSVDLSQQRGECPTDLLVLGKHLRLLALGPRSRKP